MFSTRIFRINELHADLLILGIERQSCTKSRYRPFEIALGQKRIAKLFVYPGVGWLQRGRASQIGARAAVAGGQQGISSLKLGIGIAPAAIRMMDF